MPANKIPGPTSTHNGQPEIDEGTLCRMPSPTPQFSPPQDSRGFFHLPLCAEEEGFYLYGTPTLGRGQYAAPLMLSFLYAVSQRWNRTQSIRFGVGNISRAEGIAFPPHKGHRNGLQVDIRAIRLDGEQKPVHYDEANYDRRRTQILVDIIRAQAEVTVVYFNDPKVSGVSHLKGHDDHLHVSLKAPSERSKRR